ncbi:sulfate/molybdate ABC transporter ATP-binding protein [Solicola sp. PLA-1-18]|uniref:sulfate/molybdate ABC transporter ATP-binding protein n=1 Tax=Solicola sp. PLA-1-18 TaxID=3380532 RepID=UPI003B78EA5A
MTGLDVHAVLSRGSFALDAEVAAEAGEVVALLGPNGAGKSSVLRALGGLTPLTGGHVRLGDRVLEDPAQRVRVPTAQRRVGVVFQDPLLFPHLDVRDNVAFGPRESGASKRDARATASAWLERTGLEEFAHRRPDQLSGGQRQRVAIVRALAQEPDLLLLDEPTAALDVAVTAAVRTFLRRHLASYDGVTVLVTHDPLDALVLADRVVVLDAGTVSQAGPPREVAERPRSAHVASLMGMNLVRDGDSFRTFRPSAVTLHPAKPVSSARHVWEGTVTALVPHGDAVRVQVDGEVRLLSDVTHAAVADLGLTDGLPVWASVKATETTVYDA